MCVRVPACLPCWLPRSRLSVFAGQHVRRLIAKLLFVETNSRATLRARAQSFVGEWLGIGVVKVGGSTATAGECVLLSCLLRLRANQPAAAPYDLSNVSVCARTAQVCHGGVAHVPDAGIDLGSVQVCRCVALRASCIRSSSQFSRLNSAFVLLCAVTGLAAATIAGTVRTLSLVVAAAAPS